MDFLIGENFAIEVKLKETVSQRNLRALSALREERKMHSAVVSLEKKKRKVENVMIYPWEVFLKELWAGERDPV